MRSSMMERPLLVSALLDHAERHHAEQIVVSCRADAEAHRYTFRDLARRSRQLASRLASLGVGPGDRVATLAWNDNRHLELYFGVSGAGAVLHTLNPRLAPAQLEYVIGHAEDSVLFFDAGFAPLVSQLRPRLPSVRHFVALGSPTASIGDGALDPLHEFDAWVDGGDPDYRWPELDEQAPASLCYTSGTTGAPKGVLYSHRSTLLHAMSAALPDAFGCSAQDVILPIVPMFHVNAWGLPYIACLVGAGLVLPGPRLDGPSLHALIEREGVTLSAGVPTVWQALLAHLESTGGSLSTMRRTIIGGSACPPSMLQTLEERYGVEVLHAWGMTELSPLGTVCRPKPRHAGAPLALQRQLKAKQGRAVFGVDVRIVDDERRELPWDGATSGHLEARGPWVLQRYFGEQQDTARDGWFSTGDVATIDRDGFVQITDRSKDVIKSGGEWISSIAIENVALLHPAVAMAACVAVRDERWGERPLLAVVRRPGASVEAADLLTLYHERVPRWWIPDQVVFVDSIPLGATGKMQKARLRDDLAAAGWATV